MTFKERAAGEPEAIRAWFYPGNNWGQEFVYPKKRAIELAKIANLPVLAMPTELATNLTVAATKMDDPPVFALKTAPIEAVKPSGEVVAMTEVVEAPPVQTAAAVQTYNPERSLPRTASLLPLAGLIGLLSLFAGLALWRLPKQPAL
jgi:hypothetical protein